MRYLTLSALALSLTACGGNVYEKPLPDVRDSQSVNEIAEELPMADKALWMTYIFRAGNVANGLITDPTPDRPEPKTVGEALEDQRAVLKRGKEEVAKMKAQQLEADKAELEEHNEAMKNGGF